jgi:membrane protein implicated in regulation of membrane protease activity
MFIATCAPQDLAPIRAKPGKWNVRRARQSDGAPTELEQRKEARGYKYLAPLGRSDKQCSVRLSVNPLLIPMRPLLVIVAILAALFVGVVAALWRHKKAGSTDINLIGRLGQVDIKLDPEGTVIVCGELWRARSKDGASIARHARIRVVEFKDHLALVEADSESSRLSHL